MKAACEVGSVLSNISQSCLVYFGKVYVVQVIRVLKGVRLIVGGGLARVLYHLWTQV